MSGGGKGVSSALALSNAITNLAGKKVTLIVFFFLVFFLHKLHRINLWFGLIFMCSVNIRGTDKVAADGTG